MPLKPGKSRKAIASNIRTEIRAGRPPAQAKTMAASDSATDIWQLVRSMEGRIAMLEGQVMALIAERVGPASPLTEMTNAGMEGQEAKPPEDDGYDWQSIRTIPVRTDIIVKTQKGLIRKARVMYPDELSDRQSYIYSRLQIDGVAYCRGIDPVSDLRAVAWAPVQEAA